MGRVLVLGATGAMGRYLVPELVRRGWQVDAFSLDDVPSTAGVTYFRQNTMDDGVLRDILSAERYDAIVDFMLYLPHQFAARRDVLLENTDHYIFLSSYRVYGDEEVPIRETSPRLLETSRDKDFLALDGEEYALFKAREEDILRASFRKNWTILRPTMVYSTYRYQLVGLEAGTFLPRIQEGKTVVLPENAMPLHAAMTWSGDVARLIAALLHNPAAWGETFTVGSGETVIWQEVAEIYRAVAGMEYITVPPEDYARIFRGNRSEWYKHLYDRFFDRKIDNGKILSATGIARDSFLPLARGLERELTSIRGKHPWQASDISIAMDAFLAEK